MKTNVGETLHAVARELARHELAVLAFELPPRWAEKLLAEMAPLMRSTLTLGPGVRTFLGIPIIETEEDASPRVIFTNRRAAKKLATDGLREALPLGTRLESVGLEELAQATRLGYAARLLGRGP